VLVLVVLLTIAAPAGAENSLRCNGDLVRLGEGTWQVRKACGEPDYEHHQSDLDIPGIGVVSSMREWYYNRGPQHFVRVLYFRDGDLVRIGRGGYGFSGSPAQSCDAYAFEPGMSKFEVRAICGEPSFQETRWRRYRHRRGGHHSHSVQRVDEWVYEFGSRQFPRELHFIDGKLDNVESVN
jgi:hypothetical protein